MRGALRDATVAVCVSDPVAAWARRRSATPDRVHVVPNGVDVDRFRSTPTAERAGTPFTVGFVGTLKPWHGTETLLDAVARLAATGDDSRLLVVGDGPRAAALHDRADRLGIAERIEWTGAVHARAIPGHLARMDVAVAPYPGNDGGYCSPLKLFEYMAAGLPIVASRTGAVTGVLSDGHNGVLVAPDDSAALASALASLRSHASRRYALAAAARRSAVRSHTWQAAVERILSLAGVGAPAGAAA